jgi:hypothetical protein
MKAFTYQSARSGSLVIGLGLAILVETLVLHLWLWRHHPAGFIGSALSAREHE